MASKRRYFKQLRITQFRAILELSRTGGFSAAAQALDLSTPSVWQQIRALEDELDTTLVNVKGQQVTLTEQGKILVDLAAPIVHGFDSISEQFSYQSASIPKRLSVASPANILVNELPAPVRDYHQSHPHVELSLIDMPSNPARKALEDGDVDLAVVGSLEESFPPALESDSITAFPFTLICPIDHPVLRLKRVTPKSLAKYPLVMAATGTNTRSRVDEVFDNAGLSDKLRIVCETSTKDLQLQYVQFGLGIAIVPLSPRYRANARLPHAEFNEVEFREVPDVFGFENIVILRRRHRREPEHQREFREVVLGSMGDH